MLVSRVRKGKRLDETLLHGELQKNEQALFLALEIAHCAHEALLCKMVVRDYRARLLHENQGGDARVHVEVEVAEG